MMHMIDLHTAQLRMLQTSPTAEPRLITLCGITTVGIVHNMVGAVPQCKGVGDKASHGLPVILRNSPHNHPKENSPSFWAAWSQQDMLRYVMSLCPLQPKTKTRTVGSMVERHHGSIHCNGM